MKVICWNIRKNNAKNIQTNLIVNAVQKALDKHPDMPWLLVILENTSGGETIGDQLQTALKGHWHMTCAAGGGAHTRENVLLVGGNCVCTNAQSHVGWQQAFDGSHLLLHTSHIMQVQNHGQTQSRQLRSGTTQGTVNTARRENPWNATNCRNPVVVDISAQHRSYRFGFVHSPGPQEGVSYSDLSYAEAYFSCIVRSLQTLGLDGLIGDFNMYGSEPVDPGTYGMTNVTSALGGTTFKRATNSIGNSKLDRAYLTSRFANHSLVELVDGGADTSDHAGIGITIVDVRDLEMLANVATDAMPMDI